jgi:hypothetical protein
VAERLQSEILKAGGVVSRSPADATVVNIDVDYVRWAPRDKPPAGFGTLAGILTIPATVISANQPMSTWTSADAAIFTAVGAGAATDLFVALTPTMNAEAIWSATIVANGQVVMKSSEPVYIRAGDIPLYAKATTIGPTSSWDGQKPLAVRTIHYEP